MLRNIFAFLGLFGRRGPSNGNAFFKFLNARDDPSLTNFLASNPLFRQAAINFHNKKESALTDMDKYLERQLLDQETYDKLYSNKRLEKDCSKMNRSAEDPVLRQR